MKILFPITFRGHLARQQLLIQELDKHYDLVLSEYNSPKKDMSAKSVDNAREFHEVLYKEKPDLAIIRGDRFEMLPIAMVASYQKIPIAHIEGGDLSGVIDNRVRHAITHLSDLHFCTNEESYTRLIQMGIEAKQVFNVGSLDVEYANSVQIIEKEEEPFIVVSFHPTDEENGQYIYEIVDTLENLYKVIVINSNSDYNLEHKGEQYPPDEYIQLLGRAKCLIGNSSSFLKEASILGTPVVDIGTRQHKRLKPSNVIHVPYNKQAIEAAVFTQTHLGRYEPDLTYFKPQTSKLIFNEIKKWENEKH